MDAAPKWEGDTVTAKHVKRGDRVMVRNAPGSFLHPVTNAHGAQQRREAFETTVTGVSTHRGLRVVDTLVGTMETSASGHYLVVR